MYYDICVCVFSGGNIGWLDAAYLWKMLYFTMPKGANYIFVVFNLESSDKEIINKSFLHFKRGYTEFPFAVSTVSKGFAVCSV